MEGQINTTNTDESSIYTVTDRVIIGIGYSLVSLFGFVGNSFVLAAVATCKSLQTIPNVFIANLAAADIMYCLVMPLHVISLLEEYHSYFDKMCCVVLFVAHTSIGCSICTISSIAFNRFVLTVSPMKYYRIIFRAKVVVAWIASLWICSMMIAGFPPFVLGIGQLTFDPTLHYCRSPTTNESSELYDTVLIYGYLPFQLALTFLCYFGIFARVHHHNRTMARHRRQNVDHFQQSLGGDIPAFHAIGGEVHKQQMNITRNMVLMFGGFLLCFTPHVICNHIYKECPVDGYLRLLVTLNSALNPIIYGINHPHFRRVYIKILKCDNPPRSGIPLRRVL